MITKDDEPSWPSSQPWQRFDAGHHTKMPRFVLVPFLPAASQHHLHATRTRGAG